MNNIIFTKVMFSRNLKEFKFVPKLEIDKRQEVFERLTAVLNKKLNVLDLETADEKIVNLLIENNIISQEFLRNETKNLFLDNKGNVAVTCFQREHINIISADIGYAADKCFKLAKEIEELLKNKLELAYSDEYGYLTSDITRIGTGLRIESGICLPCITSLGKISQVKQNLRKSGYELTAMGADSADYYIVSTAANLGYTESQIYNEYDKMISKLQELEIESAKLLDSNNHDEMFDQTVRSVAIMNNAYLMPSDELKNHLTNIRTGMNLDYIIGLKLANINKIQQLISNKNESYISKSQLIELADRTKKILKGE